MRRVGGTMVLLQALVAGGYSGQEKSGRTSGPSPSDVLLTVRTHGGQSVFHTGERIQLELAFTSTAPGTYQLYATRSGRTPGSNPVDRVTVEPNSGWVDPSGAFFRFCPVILGEALENTPFLSPQPNIVSEDLNEWIRFEVPGEYQITVQSERVSRRNAGRWKGQVILRSNPLSISIVSATKQWQDQTLERALAVLDGPGSVGDSSWTRELAIRGAAKTLSYLGTADAAREMARRLHYDDYGYDFILGLVGSPAREVVLDRMKELLVAPDFPVDGQFLCAMSVVAMPTDATANLEAQQKAFEARFRDELKTALKNKHGTALSVSTQTVRSAQ